MYAVVRMRGVAGVRKEIEDTLKMLRLKSVNNCVVVPETESYKGMLEKIKDVATYGEMEKEMLVKLLEKRGRMGSQRIDPKKLKYNSFVKIAEDMINNKIKLNDIGINPVFRLTPPSKGFNSVKLHYPKGDLGYRGKDINNLLERMI